MTPAPLEYSCWAEEGDMQPLKADIYPLEHSTRPVEGDIQPLECQMEPDGAGKQAC